MPCAHERRNVSVPSWYHLIWCSTSTRRSSGSACTVNSSHQQSWETSGLNRRIFTVSVVTVRGAPRPTGPRRSSDPCSTSAERGHQYFLSMGTYGPIFTGLKSSRIEPSSLR